MSTTTPLHEIAARPLDIAPGFTTAMATPGAKPLGVTAPLSLNMPTEQELQANDALITELKRQNNYESPAETSKR